LSTQLKIEEGEKSVD